MTQLEFKFGNPTVNILRSRFNTMQNYHKTSMAFHGRPTQSATSYARRLAEFALEVQKESELGSGEARWAAKCIEYLVQNGYEVKFE